MIDTLPVLKDFATLLAAAGALLYFGYKIIAGWLLLNLSVELTTERRSDQSQEDQLVVSISLQKGRLDAARLLAGEVRLTPLEKPDLEIIVRPLSEMQRIDFPRGGPAHWDKVDSKNRYLTLSTDETMNLAEYFRIHRNVVYRVDVVIQGDRFRDRLIPSLSQWRSSAIVLPSEVAT